MGLADAAILYITKAPHEEITWITADDGKEQGIAFSQIDFPDANPNPPIPGGTKARADFMKDRATEFVNSLFAAWSKPNDEALPALARLYSKQVSYYGVLQPAQSVMLDKQRSAERWPEREYTLRPNSLSVTCTQGTLACEVDGIVNWKVGNSETKTASTG